MAASVSDPSGIASESIFWDSFERDCGEVMMACREAGTGLGDAAASWFALDEIERRAHSIRKRLSGFVANHGREKYRLAKAHRAVREMDDAIRTTRGSGLRQGKFTFRSKEKYLAAVEVQSEARDVECSAPVVASGVASPEVRIDGARRIGHRFDEEIQVQCSGETVILDSLRGCTVELKGLVGSLSLRGLERCSVCCGVVGSSVRVDSCSETQIAVTCRQLRIHESRRCDIRAHVNAGPVIERCEHLRIGPLDLIDEQELIDGGLEPSMNLWAEVHDFSWLRTDPSPNWRVLDDEESRSVLE